MFSKGDTTNWSYELFKIYEIVKYKPPQYLIEDEQEDKIIGTNYEPELLNSSFSFHENKKKI